jgi:hypothetical protein
MEGRKESDRLSATRSAQFDPLTLRLYPPLSKVRPFPINAIFFFLLAEELVVVGELYWR